MKASKLITKAAIIVSLIVVLVIVAYAVLINPNSDLNNDGRVDGNDLTIFARSFGSKRGDSNYNEKADLSNDGRVDGNDLTIFARDFGKTAEKGDLLINVISPVDGSTIDKSELMLSLTTNRDAECSYTAFVEAGKDGEKLGLQATSGTEHSQTIKGIKNRKSYIIKIECSDNLKNKAVRFISFNTDFKVIEGRLSLATTYNTYYTDEGSRIVTLTDPPGASDGNAGSQSISTGVSTGVSITENKPLNNFPFEKYADYIEINKKTIFNIFQRGIPDYEPLTGVKEKKVTFKVDPSKVELFKIDDYDYLKVENLKPFTKEGEPQLPMKTFVIELPRNIEVVDFNILDGYYVDVLESLNIIPTPKPIPLDMTSQVVETIPDGVIYNSDEFFPGKLASYEVRKDNQNTYVYIRVFPVQYIPEKKEVTLVTEMSLVLQYLEKSDEEKKEPPIVIDSESIIITPPEFNESSKTLADFHINKEGISTSVVTTEWIYENYNEADDPPYSGCKDNCASLIKNGYKYSLAKKTISFLNDIKAHPNLKYITLMGEGLNMPASYYVSVYGYVVATDFFYSSPDYDLMPNYMVGRLPVNNVQEAEHLVQKIIKWYDALGGWYNNLVVSGGEPFGTDYYTGELTMLDSINRGYFNGFNIIKQYETDNTFDRGYMTQILSRGNAGIVYHFGHGGGNVMELKRYKRGISVEDVMAYESETKVPILASVACANGQYDINIFGGVYGDYKKSFAEGVLLSPAGAVAYIGGSRTNYAGYSYHLQLGEVIITKEPYMPGMLTYTFEGYANGEDTLGGMTMYAVKKYIEENDVNYNEVDGLTLFEFTLLGDAALKIPIPEKKQSYQQPSLTALGPTTLRTVDSGIVPSYKIPKDSQISAEITTDSPTIKPKVVNINKGGVVIQNEPTDERIYKFTPPSPSYYSLIVESEDKKEGRLYFDAGLVVEGVDLFADLGFFQPPIQGYSTEIPITLSNEGNLDEEEAKYTLYLIKNQGEPNEEKEVIKEKSTSIAAGEKRIFNIKWKPEVYGSYTLRLEVSSANDVNSKNNADSSSIYIVPYAPDLKIKSINFIGKHVVNRPSKIIVDIRNSGVQSAKNAALSLYRCGEGIKGIKDCTLMARKQLSTIYGQQGITETIDWTPDSKGNNQLKLAVECSDDEVPENNAEFPAVYVVPDAPDIKGEIYWTRRLIADQTNAIEVGIENIGIQEAKDVTASLYEKKSGEDGEEILELIGDQNIGTMVPGESKEIAFYWVPTEIGLKELKSEVGCTDDGDLENNVDHQTLEVVPNAPDVKGYIYFDWKQKVIVDQPNELKIRIQNEGVKKAENVKASLYKAEQKDGKEDWILINEADVEDLEPDEWEEVSFIWTPNKIGYQRFKLVTACSDDGNPENNVYDADINVVPNAPDVRGYINIRENLVADKQNNIVIGVYNGGVKEATNTIVGLYKVEWKDGKTSVDYLIGEIQVGSLKPDKEKKLTIGWSPDEEGRTELKLVVNCDNDGNQDNNINDLSVNVVSKSLIKNTGTIGITGYLLMRVEKRLMRTEEESEDGNAAEEEEKWIETKVIVDDKEPRTIPPGETFALDKVWADNGFYEADEEGRFRVYAALRNENGDVIQAYDGTYLGDSYEFSVY